VTFIRSKEIPPRSGNWYDYEVKTIHEGRKVRQKVVRYLGRRGSYSLSSTGRTVKEIKPTVAQVVIDKPVKPARVERMKTPAKLIASALGMYFSGMSLDAIQQQFKQDHDNDMSESNYWNWIKRFTEEAVRQSKNFKPKVGNTWVADETYMKLGKRNVYFWDIIDADTRYILATHVSFTRNGRDAKRLMELARKRAGKTPKVVVTDKLRS
jgi:transposase InsO family protein